jgi:hypothetical protein
MIDMMMNTSVLQKKSLQMIAMLLGLIEKENTLVLISLCHKMNLMRSLKNMLMLGLFKVKSIIKLKSIFLRTF